MSRNWVLSVSMIRFGLASLARALRKSFCVLRAWFQEVRSGGLSHVDPDGFAKVMLTRQDCCFSFRSNQLKDVLTHFHEDPPHRLPCWHLLLLASRADPCMNHLVCCWLPDGVLWFCLPFLFIGWLSALTKSHSLLSIHVHSWMSPELTIILFSR